MIKLVQRLWLLFDLAEEPDEVDIFGGFCTLVALPANLTTWLFTMNTLNGILSLVISILSIAWLLMRVYREWGATKEHIQKQLKEDEAT